MSTEELLRQFGGDGGVHEEDPPDSRDGDPHTIHYRVEALEEGEHDGKQLIGIHVSCYMMDFWSFTFPPGSYFPRYL